MGASASANARAGAGAEARDEASAGAEPRDDVRTELRELKEQMRHWAETQNAIITGLSEKMEGLNIRHNDEIAAMRQQIEKMQRDASAEEEITREKERQYQKQINALESKIEYLENQLQREREQNREIDNAKSKPEQSMAGAQTLTLEDPSVNTEHVSGSPEAPLTSRDIAIKVSVRSSDSDKKKQGSSEVRRWRYK
ncbi:uncharacterized protein LOC110461174 [Mizuhopecten yessoensis]|uniref:Uncharacterized protein n=1 Tax=Mizuhopecten yessoensis TaxID=6573 RepID=A0A210Q0W4_MIZYE|nr:uncharacterized protein LOC110461174 [Mizuhopecten yessoensis]OWF42378.1 hypothetical protein KP79_PYT24553 [Mizuhopecten yessoensis]